MFAKKKPNEVKTLEGEIADLRRRHAALAGQVTDAAAQADAAAVALQGFFEDGDLADAKTRTRLEAAALAADGRAAPLRRALETLADKIEAAEQRLVEARERAEREALYAKAKQAAAEAERRLSTEYETHARAIVELIGLTAEALTAIDAANRALPDGAEPITTPTVLLRGHPELPEEVLSETVIEAWALASDLSYVRDQTAVRPDPNSRTRGTLRASLGVNGVGGISIQCIRARFRRIEYLPREARSTAHVLHELLVLPALYDGAAPYWDASTSRSAHVSHVPALVRESLDARRPKAPAVPERQPQVRHVAIAAVEPPPPPPSPEDEEAELQRLVRLGERNAPGSGAFLGHALPSGDQASAPAAPQRLSTPSPYTRPRGR